MGDYEGRFIGDLWDRIRAFFLIQNKEFFSSLMDILPNFIDALHEKTWEILKGYDDPLWDLTIDFLKKSDLLSPGQESLYRTFKDLPPPFSSMVWVIFTASFLVYYVTKLNDLGNDKLKQKMMQEHQTTLPPLDALIRSAFIAPEKTEAIREHLSKYGFNNEAVDFLFLSNYRLYDIDLCRELYHRGVLSKDKLFERMRELGFTDTRIEELVQGFPVIPGPSDLFHLVGKEAFEPDTIEKLGLGQEFPEGQVSWLEKQGVSRYWAKKYWAAHWYQPSVQQGMAMRHRDLIDDDTMDLLFRAQELPPFWRDKIKGITYLPYARVDIRRLWKSGVINEVREVYDNYKWQGYDHEHAVNLTEFAILDAEESERNITMGQIMNAYENKIMSRKDIKALLIQLHYTLEKAEFLILSKDYEIANQFEKAKIKLIGDKYINRLIDKFQAFRDLNLLNLPSEQVSILMTTWDLKIIKNVKLPSKTDIAKFFKAKIIDEKIYIEEMDRLGYSEHYSSMYLQLTKKQMGV